MSNPPPAENLQFNIAEPAGAPTGQVLPARSCDKCGVPIISSYYAVRGHVLCPDCAASFGKGPAGFIGLRILNAILMGVASGLVGALVWYLVRHYLGLQIGLIAILVGYMVGKSVLRASGNVGGQPFQILAVLITYACVAANYMPDLVSYLVDNGYDPGPITRNPAGWAKLLWASYTECVRIPFQGSVSPIGLLIIFFALLEAWRLNRSRTAFIQGPYQIGAGPVSRVQARSVASQVIE